jgi:hypothetical protein
MYLRIGKDKVIDNITDAKGSTIKKTKLDLECSRLFTSGNECTRTDVFPENVVEIFLFFKYHVLLKRR